MYSTCLFCHAALGTNESIEHFPVGQRLAFDASKGRLWVVCRNCARWNLSPYDERYEGIEEAERAYRDTKKRVATEHVGLARLRDGTDLIRIGKPLRPEFAAWRYGDTFGKRRRKNLLRGASAAVGTGALIAGAGMGLYAVGGALMSFSIASHFAFRGWMKWSERVTRLTLMGSEGEVIGVSRLGVGAALVKFYRASADDPGQIAITVIDNDLSKPAKSVTLRGLDGEPRTVEHRGVEIAGAAAHQALARILATTSGVAGSKRDVSHALSLLENSPSPYALLSALPEGLMRRANRRFFPKIPGAVMVSGLAPQARLALEMSLHEESERRALEGELHELEDRWKEAEEIAAISDSLFFTPKGDAPTD